LQAAHGVESVALCGWPLMTNNTWSDGVWINGRPTDNDEPYFLTVSDGWLDTMRIPVLDGRDFRIEDTYPGAAIVNEAFARRYFDGHNPVGKTFETMVSDKLKRSQIIGYVRDARYRNMREPVRPTVYIPFGNHPADWATLMVRTTSANPLDVARDLRREVSRARSEFRVTNVRTQTELVEQHTVRERLLAMLSLFFAVVALVLAFVGIFGVLNYSVLQRQREIGIRMALGSSGARVARLITSQILAMLLFGAAAGLAAGVGCQRYIATLLYQVNATDPAMAAIPALAIFFAAFLAAISPVVRAVRIDPAVTLRAQ
jgi:putative ABC transport system permease protein